MSTTKHCHTSIKSSCILPFFLRFSFFSGNVHTHPQALSGIVSVAEDWHAKANFLGVSNIIHFISFSNINHLVVLLQLIFRYYYSTQSAGDHGSLYQLRNCIGRTNVVKKPLDNFNAL